MTPEIRALEELEKINEALIVVEEFCDGCGLTVDPRRALYEDHGTFCGPECELNHAIARAEYRFGGDR